VIEKSVTLNEAEKLRYFPEGASTEESATLRWGQAIQSSAHPQTQFFRNRGAVGRVT
jgi:hypothetical protein